MQAGSLKASRDTYCNETQPLVVLLPPAFPAKTSQCVKCSHYIVPSTIPTVEAESQPRSGVRGGSIHLRAGICKVHWGSPWRHKMTLHWHWMSSYWLWPSEMVTALYLYSTFLVFYCHVLCGRPRSSCLFSSLTLAKRVSDQPRHLVLLDS